MGVDYYNCKTCNEIYSDHDFNLVSCDCGVTFCSEKCADLKPVKEDDEEWHTCKICRGEKISDSELLAFILRTNNSSRKEWEEDYREWRNDKDK